MISYPNAISEGHAAELAAQDTETWTKKEREALQLIANYESWWADWNILFQEDRPTKEIEEYEKTKPLDVSEVNSFMGKGYTVYPGKKYSLTFYIHPAAKGYNIGLKNSDLGK